MLRSSILLTLVLSPFALQAAETPASVSYYRQVRPVLQRECSGCHQPAKSGGSLLLTSFGDFQKGGESGATFVPGKAGDSLIVQYISGEKPEMPRGADPLKPEVIALIRGWIEQGAKDDTPETVKELVDAAHPPVYHTPPVISAMAYSPDSKLLAVGGYHEVLVHQADGSGVVARLIGRAPKITSVRFSPNGQWLGMTGGAPALFGEVQMWSVECLASRVEGQNASTPSSPTLDPPADADRVDNVEAVPYLKHSVNMTFDTLFGGSFSDDSQSFAFGSFDNKVRLLTVADGKVTMSMDAHSDLVFATTFSLKNDHLISVSRDMSMKLTEIKTAQFIDNITSITPGALKGGLMAVQRHPKEEQILTGGADGEPKLYKIFRTQARQIGDDFNRVRGYPALPGRIVSLQFNADGSKFVVGASNATSGSARIYNTDDAKLLFELPGHKGGVFAVAFRPDGKQVATGGMDGVVRLFDVENGQLVKEFVPVNITAAVAAK